MPVIGNQLKCKQDNWLVRKIVYMFGAVILVRLKESVELPFLKSAGKFFMLNQQMNGTHSYL